jgi:hypothetical protein
VTSSGWHIIEEENWQRAIAQLGGARRVDRAIAPIIDALHRNPEGFDRVPGFSSLYLARTKLAIRQLEVIPSYRVWFRTDVAERTVYLLWIEIAPPEDMGLTDNLWDDDLPL